jgi:hypothetical protein
MIQRFLLILIACLIALPSLVDGQDKSAVSPGADMIVWEHQNWETNGGFKRLTLWSDGHSEVVTAPLRLAHDDQANLRPRSGWELVRHEHPHHVEFIRRDIYPADVTRTKFQQALDAGILLLKSFKPGYVDGGGTRVVVRMNGQRKEAVIPMFMDKDKGTMNHKRFLAVSKILDGFDTDAFEVITK